MLRKKICGIYKIENKVNGKVYIGSSIDIEVRWKNHIRSLNGKDKYFNDYLHRQWREYGEENFIFNIIEECNVYELDKKEQYWIEFYDSMDRENGYNLKEAGKRGKLSEETRRKLSIAAKGKIFSEETRKKLSIAAKGRQAFKDHKHSDNTKEKMSKSRISYFNNNPDKLDELKESLKEGRFKGNSHSKESKEKISNSMKGKMAGSKHHSLVLTKQQGEEILIKLNNGAKVKDLSLEYCCRQDIIRQIKAGSHWTVREE